MPRKNRNSQEPTSEGAPEWMTTYSDLVTLLLCFFVLLFSMAVIDKQKFVEVANSFKSSFQNTQSGGNMFYTDKGNSLISILDQSNWNNNVVGQVDTELQENEDKKFNDISEKLQDSINNQNLKNHLSVIEENEKIIIRFDSTILFDSGKADLKETGKDILLKIGNILAELNNEIIVLGHTDNRPISTALFPTNWELSTKRATNVVLFLIENAAINPKLLTASGNGEYKPLAPNDTEVNRQKNRRVDFEIYKNYVDK